MDDRKLLSYLGFAAKSRNLVTGYNTCLMMIERKRLRLLIVAEDISPNTVKKMRQKCLSNSIEFRIFGDGDVLSRATGQMGKGIFGITDDHFAEILCKEIDRIQSEREVF